MWNTRENNAVPGSGGSGGAADGRGEKYVAIAIDKDKSSQYALKWAIDRIITKDDTVKLIHVKERTQQSHGASPRRKEDYCLLNPQIDSNASELFLPFRCYCRRRQVNCETIVIEDSDVAKALTEYVCQNGIQTLLLGTASRNGLTRLFKTADIPGNVLKLAPDFCTVYVVSKGKINTVRKATHPVPALQAARASSLAHHNINEDPSTQDVSGSQIWYDELSVVDMENSVAHPGRQSTDSNFFNFYENLGCEFTRDISPRQSDVYQYEPYSPAFTPRNNCLAWSPSGNHMEEYEEEMRRLKIELKQTIDMYHTACKDALAAKQEAFAAKKKAAELEEWKRKKEKRLKEAHVAEENVSTMAEREVASAMAERETVKCKLAMEAAEAVQKVVEIEVQKRLDAEMKALKESVEKQKVIDDLGQSNIVVKYQSLFHMIAVFFLFYFYFSVIS